VRIDERSYNGRELIDRYAGRGIRITEHKHQRRSRVGARTCVTAAGYQKQRAKFGV
jgi:hypothetical protein